MIKAAADELWQDPAWSGEVLEEPEVWGVESLAPDGVTIRLVVKTQPAEQFQVLRELRGRIKAALDEAGVEIATTQRTLVMQRDPGIAPTAGDDPDAGLSAGSVASGGEGDLDGERRRRPAVVSSVTTPAARTSSATSSSAARRSAVSVTTTALDRRPASSAWPRTWPAGPR